ncbi:MAG: 2-oxo acid dehydrogenase subunit E2 [Candidatus Marinimicrobia bacterium]|nr:2-oxo acid dehydrogenase subunit E2 [Candidatus Neomarinimicrobiota bacterium]
MKKTGYSIKKLSFNRRLVAASSSVSREFNTIHTITEADITNVRSLMSQYHNKTGERLSLTAYVVCCLAKAIEDNPGFNSFRKGRKLILLEDVNIGVLVEREFGGEITPEPVTLTQVQELTYLDIHTKIRENQALRFDQIGEQAGMKYIRFIPSFLLKYMIRIGSRSIKMAKRFGKVAVTSVGMFGDTASWFIPISSATILVTVGGIKKTMEMGKVAEALHLTISFNHDIIDGAPAARFTKRLIEIIESGQEIIQLTNV